MARALKRAGSLRLRLLSAFALVSVPPLLVLAMAVQLLVDRAFDAAVSRRIGQVQASAQRHFQSLERRALREIDAIAEDADGAPLDERTAVRLAEMHGLQSLEILDDRGNVLSSAHWPAGFGLPDRDVTFADAPAFRLETAAEGYGETQRLTLTASRRATAHGERVVVRGGYFLDDAFWAEMRALVGVEIGLRDTVRGTFATDPESPLRDWTPGAPAGEGSLSGGLAYRWVSSPLGPSLALYVAAPTAEWEALSRRVRLTSLAVASGSLLAAIVLGVALARRITLPASALAQAARRVAAGDLSAQAAVVGDDELAGLARAFNQMTSDLRATQDRLLQAERVAAWREIARRVAHELKNPIFPIALSLQTLQRATSGLVLPTSGSMDLTALLRDSLATALAELARLQRIIDEFSGFARLPRAQPAPTPLGPVVEAALALYQARAHGVTLQSEIDTTLPPALADADLLARAVGNLVANALEAMPDGGTLTARTRRQDGSAVLEIEDTGPGLTDDQKARLFTPYFTTKSGGTGLGLVIVQGIASDLGGRVEARPAVPHGTVFALVLPLAPEDVRHSVATTP